MLENIVPVSIRNPKREAEISWFCDICGGDTEFLGTLDGTRRSNFEHCKDILLTADQLGYKNILLPTSYTVGQDQMSFASAIAPMTNQINLLLAVRTGEIHPPMLARYISSLDHILNGRLTINIINSELPGNQETAELRYERCAEVIEILKLSWKEQDRVQFKGNIYNVDLPADPVKPYQQNGGPLLYFGGIADGARELCAKYCDVFLMWPEPEENLYDTMKDMSARAAKYNRSLDFGLRIHVIVRETEAEAKDYTWQLMSKFDEQMGLNLKNRTQDAHSVGVVRQDELRQKADDDGFIEPLLWTGIGRARSGCGGALVGTPDQILAQINRYMDMGIRSFIFSGYPLIEESKLFAKYVLPHLPNVSMPKVQNRIPLTTPATPLTFGNLR